MKAGLGMFVLLVALLMALSGKKEISDFAAWLSRIEDAIGAKAIPSDRVLAHERFVVEGKTVEELLARFEELEELWEQESLAFEEKQLFRRKYAESISEEFIKKLLIQEDLSQVWGLALSYQWGRLNPRESIDYFIEKYQVVTTTESDRNWLPKYYASCLREAIVGWSEDDPKSSWDFLKDREWGVDDQFFGEGMEFSQLANYEVFKNLAAADHEFALNELKAKKSLNSLLLSGFGRGAPEGVDWRAISGEVLGLLPPDEWQVDPFKDDLGRVFRYEIFSRWLAQYPAEALEWYYSKESGDAGGFERKPGSSEGSADGQRSYYPITGSIMRWYERDPSEAIAWLGGVIQSDWDSRMANGRGEMISDFIFKDDFHQLSVQEIRSLIKLLPEENERDHVVSEALSSFGDPFGGNGLSRLVQSEDDATQLEEVRKLGVSDSVLKKVEEFMKQGASNDPFAD